MFEVFFKVLEVEDARDGLVREDTGELRELLLGEDEHGFFFFPKVRDAVGAVDGHGDGKEAAEDEESGEELVHLETRSPVGN